MVLDFLTADERTRAQHEFGLAADPAWFMITPRFRASSHVIVLLLAEATRRPALALKIARLPGDCTSLAREAACLRDIEASGLGGYDSIPRVIGYGERHRHPVLVETALNGSPMDGPTVRSNQAICCARVVSWLIGLQSASRSQPQGDWHARLIGNPLDVLLALLGGAAGDERLIQETRERTASLHASHVPLVCEHGDVSHPNLLLTADGVGVLDWETAEPAGLPACDLFFFLTFIALAQRRWWWRQSHTAAFDQAFFGPSAWARPYVERYAAALGLSASALLPLFLATWPRYLAGLVDRLGERGTSSADRGATAAWLRSNRYYALWRRAMERSEQVCWNDRVV